MKLIKKDFPIFKRKKNNKKLIYLDSSSTSQKPKTVINAIKDFYENNNANINRGIHTLGNEATELYENTRKNVANFINSDKNEIVFVKNTTEAINLVAHCYVKPKLNSGDFILLTEMEHHSNLIPWQIIAKEKNTKLKFIPVNENGLLDLDKAKKLLSEKPKFFALTHISNFLGTINDVKELVTLSHYYGVPILVDAAQSAPHIKIDVKDLDCDFLAFSAHKMLGPAGIGVLYGKKKLLDSMEIIFGGGGMILEADYNNFIPRESPYKFEAGTPNIADVVAFSEAVKYLEKIGMDKIEKYEKELTDYAYLKLSKIKNIKIYGSNIKNRSSLISFNYFDNSERLIHPHDIATIMDEEGIALRAGHHCVMPLHKKLNIPASIRISFHIYNSKADINKFIRVLDKVNKIFNKK